MADMFSRRRRSEIMANIHSADTSPELVLRRMIHAMGCRFRLHSQDLPGKPDIVLPKYKLVVLMNGCFWHGHSCKDGRRPVSNSDYWNVKLDRNIRRDRRNLRELRRLGWRCIVVWECQLASRVQKDKVARRILRSIGLDPR